MNLHLEATRVKAAIDAIMAQFPELEGDEALRLDTLEGETSLHNLLSNLVEAEARAVETVTGIKARMDELSERRARMLKRSEAARALIFKIMTAADAKKIVLPEATLSITVGRNKIVVADETSLPESCLRVKREPDLTAIRAFLEGGACVPGATLSNSEPTLSIRKK